eukprot:2052515-Prymnesium_polylepis.1
MHNVPTTAAASSSQRLKFATAAVASADEHATPKSRQKWCIRYRAEAKPCMPFVAATVAISGRSRSSVRQSCERALAASSLVSSSKRRYKFRTGRARRARTAVNSSRRGATMAVGFFRIDGCGVGGSVARARRRVGGPEVDPPALAKFPSLLESKARYLVLIL